MNMNLHIQPTSAFARRSLAAAQALVTAGPAEPAAPAPEPLGAAQPRTALDLRWINPGAQDRWLTPGLRFYTPQMVELILRGALAGDLQRQQEMFKLMEDTWPRLTANLKKLREKACSIEWYVEAWAPKGEKPSAEAERRAARFEDAIFNMRPDPVEDENEFEGTLFDVLDAWGCGLAVLEILWDSRPAPEGPLIVPRATRWVHPQHYGYDAGGYHPDRLRLRTASVVDVEAGTAGDWMDFPADKFLIAVAKQKSGSAAAGALLRSLGFFWAAQNFSWEWFLNFAQLFGLPIRWANYSRSADADTISKVEQMLTNLGSAGWAAFPEGTTLQILEAMKAQAEGPHERLNAACDTVCDILILGQTLTSDVGASGSRALGEVHQRVLSVREKAVARFAARVLNAQLAPAFCRLNFGDDGECPYLVPQIGEEENAKATADMLEVARRIGIEIPVNFAHERLGIPLPKRRESTLPPPSADPAGAANPHANPGGVA